MGYTEGDQSYLVYIPNLSKVMAIQDALINGSDVGPQPDNTETSEQLNEMSEKLGIT